MMPIRFLKRCQIPAPASLIPTSLIPTSLTPISLTPVLTTPRWWSRPGTGPLLCGNQAPGPFLLLLFASVLATEDIQIAFGLDERWIHGVTEAGNVLSVETRETRGPSLSEPDDSGRPPPSRRQSIRQTPIR
jgi:hypothetical protein